MKQITPFVSVTAIFNIYSRLSDWRIMKTKAKQIVPLGNAWISHARKTGMPTKKFFSTELFFLLVNLFTPSFTFGLHLNWFIDYWKSYVNYYTSGKTPKTKWQFESNLRQFSYFKGFVGLGQQSFCPWTLSGGLQCSLTLAAKALCLQRLVCHLTCRYSTWYQI